MVDPIYGQVKAGKSALIGNAGEYFVLAELLRRGIVAALAPRNMADYDILAVDDTRSVKIRVKTKTAAADSFVWNAKADGETIFRGTGGNDISILVDLDTPDSRPLYYGLRTSDLDMELKKGYNEWLAAPGRGGGKRGETRVRRLFPSWKGWSESEAWHEGEPHGS